jgi:hypothetical protein
MAQILLHKAGSQFIETVAPGARGAEFAAAPAYDSWAFLEKRLREGLAAPDEIARVKADFDSGKPSTSIALP